MRLEDLTWTCHICKAERPDPKIAVHKTQIQVSGISIQQNVRYCVDNPECVKAAPSYSFLKEQT